MTEPGNKSSPLQNCLTGSNIEGVLGSIDRDENRIIDERDLEASNFDPTEFADCAVKLAELYPKKIDSISRSILLRASPSPRKKKSNFIPDLKFRVAGCHADVIGTVPKNADNLHKISIAVYNNFQINETETPLETGGLLTVENIQLILPTANILEWKIMDSENKILERRYISVKGTCVQFEDRDSIVLIQNNEEPEGIFPADFLLFKDLTDYVALYNGVLPEENKIRVLFWNPDFINPNPETQRFEPGSKVIHLRTSPEDPKACKTLTWYEGALIYYSYLKEFAPVNISRFESRYKLLDEEDKLVHLLDTIFSVASYEGAPFCDIPDDTASLFANISTILRLYQSELTGRLSELSKNERSSVIRTIRYFLNLYIQPNQNILSKHFRLKPSLLKMIDFR